MLDQMVDSLHRPVESPFDSPEAVVHLVDPIHAHCDVMQAHGRETAGGRVIHCERIRGQGDGQLLGDGVFHHREHVLAQERLAAQDPQVVYAQTDARINQPQGFLGAQFLLQFPAGADQAVLAAQVAAISHLPLHRRRHDQGVVQPPFADHADQTLGGGSQLRRSEDGLELVPRGPQQLPKAQ
jgi:hypothetical protein